MELEKIKRRKKKKGQLSIGDAPTVVLLVALVFLVMATTAFIGEKYEDALTNKLTSYSALNETLTTVTEAGEYLYLNSLRDPVCSISRVINTTSGELIASGNYTTTNCLIQATSHATTSGYNNTNWNVTYTGTYSQLTVASNTTAELQTEISNNTSIAGIVLTISLIGIVLGILISVFLGMRRPRI